MSDRLQFAKHLFIPLSSKPLWAPSPDAVGKTSLLIDPAVGSAAEMQACAVLRDTLCAAALSHEQVHHLSLLPVTRTPLCEPTDEVPAEMARSLITATGANRGRRWVTTA